jgi:hypothetical protein
MTAILRKYCLTTLTLFAILTSKLKHTERLEENLFYLSEANG